MVCFNLQCHHPLKATPNSEHWVESMRMLVEQLQIGFTQLFPNASQADSSSILPCGIGCTFSLSFNSRYELPTQVTVFVFGCVGIIFSTIAILAFLLNQKKLSCLPRRMMFYFNVAYIIGHGSDSLLALAADGSNGGVPCYSDGTLRLDEPRHGPSLCTFLAWKVLFGTMFMAAIFLAIVHEWHIMVLILKRSTMKTDSGQLLKGRAREITYFTAALIFSITIASVPVARQRIVGVPAYSSCFLEQEDQFYFFSLPLGILIVGMVGHLFHGLPILLNIYKGFRGYAKHLRRVLSFSAKKTTTNSQQRKSSIDGLESLIALLTVHMVCAISGQAAIALVFSYIFISRHEMEERLQSYLLCQMTSCNPSACRHWKQLHPAVTIVPNVLGSLVAILVSMWALNWTAYWQKPVLRLRANMVTALSSFKRHRSCQSSSDLQTVDRSIDEVELTVGFDRSLSDRPT